jgi:hypothetical protein
LIFDHIAYVLYSRKKHNYSLHRKTVNLDKKNLLNLRSFFRSEKSEKGLKVLNKIKSYVGVFINAFFNLHYNFIRIYFKIKLLKFLENLLIIYGQSFPKDSVSKFFLHFNFYIKKN